MLRGDLLVQFDANVLTGSHSPDSKSLDWLWLESLPFLNSYPLVLRISSSTWTKVFLCDFWVTSSLKPWYLFFSQGRKPGLRAAFCCSPPPSFQGRLGVRNWVILWPGVCQLHSLIPVLSQLRDLWLGHLYWFSFSFVFLRYLPYYFILHDSVCWYSHCNGFK